jgi:hypothetical protein
MIESFLYPMLLKCHHHLDPLIEFETNIANQGIDKYYNLNFPQMTTNISELKMELVN